MMYEITVSGRLRRVRVERSGAGYLVAIDDGPPRAIDARRLPNDTLSMIVQSRSFDAVLTRRAGGFDVNVLGTQHACEVVDPRRAALRVADGAAEGLLATSMPGRVVAVHVQAGDAVERGQPVVVVEAMKMENELKAPCAGTVTDVLVRPGQPVEANAKLLRITPRS